MKRHLISKTLLHVYFIILIVLLNVSKIYADETNEPGLLFYLSGENGFTADYAHGDSLPITLSNAEIIDDGALGHGLMMPHLNYAIAYNAPGNVYAERGTLSFFFRSREPWGETPYKIFHVSYNDHSSFDM